MPIKLGLISLYSHHTSFKAAQTRPIIHIEFEHIAAENDTGRNWKLTVDNYSVKPNWAISIILHSVNRVRISRG